jgi:hypothetical protein
VASTQRPSALEAGTRPLPAAGALADRITCAAKTIRKTRENDRQSPRQVPTILERLGLRAEMVLPIGWATKSCCLSYTVAL